VTSLQIIKFETRINFALDKLCKLSRLKFQDRKTSGSVTIGAFKKTKLDENEAKLIGKT